MLVKLSTRQPKLMRWILAPGLLALLISPAVFGQERAQKPSPKPPQSATELERLNTRKLMQPPSGPSFYIGPVDGSASMFSVLLADGAGNTVAGTFTLRQIEVFEVVLEAAKAFALTDEKVGSGAPITTRLMEQHEWSLFVDVSKIGDKSRFYISLVTPQGKLTAPAGEITRGSKKEHSAMLLEALSQLIQAKGALPSR
jgi:hypothetical protein